MRFATRVTAATSVMLAAVLSPMAAWAAEPDTAVPALSVPAKPSVVAQALPAGAGRSPPRPRGPTATPLTAPGPAPTTPEDQSVNPGNNTTGDQTLEDIPAPTSPPPRVGFFPGVGTTLLNNGIDFHGLAFDHLLANPNSGAQRGQVINLGALRPLVDFDLQKIAGIPGGNFHLGLTFFGARGDIPQGLTQAGGVLTGFQTTPATQTNLVSIATYEQRLLNNTLSIEAGRTNVYNYFFLPNGLDPFTYYSPLLEITSDFNSNPYPVWGGRATYKINRDIYLQGGAFEDDYRDAVNYGDRLGTANASGVSLLGEVGYRQEFNTAAYPANAELGIEWNTRNGRSNLKGTGAPAIPLLQRPNYPGGGVLFFQGQKVVWRGARNEVGPPANIAVYGSFDVALEKPQPFDVDAQVGVNVTGFVPRRPFDALGLQAKYLRQSQVEANSESLRQLITVGRGPSQPRDGFAFEAIYNIQVTPAIAFRPLIEYFVNPDNYYPPAPRPGRPRDGIETGFFAVVSLGRLLGTSIKPF